tara:strand:+ start:19132 stop:19374 length:243 start_codon:yes stop_codon:yes gene_type:complete
LHLRDRLERITVQLDSERDRGGSPDKLCIVGIKAKGVTGIEIEETQRDFFLAADRAIARAKRRLARKLRRSAKGESLYLS